MKKKILSTVVLLLLVSTPLFSIINTIGLKVSAEMVPPELQYVVTDWHSQDGSSPSPYVASVYGDLAVECVRTPSHNSPFMILLINDTLWDNINQTKIYRYMDDVENSGLDVYGYTLFAGSPEGIRGWLAGWGSDLVGCLLVGNIPSAWYQMFHDPPWSGSTYEEFPIDLFYMDLDGTWSDGLTGPWPGPPTPKTPGADGMYDGHTGDVGPEIWIGRIKADDMAASEVGLIANYFDKNHNYRTGSLTLPQRALVYVDDDWAPGTGVSDAVKLAYPDSTLVNDKNTTKKTDYLDRLGDQWSWVHVMCHGNPGGHTFKILNATGDSVGEGLWVTWNDYRTGDYPVFFYNLFVCSGARFTSENYLAGWCIFAPTYGLAAISSTKTGGMLWDGDFYDPLGDGNTLGEAFKSWVDKTVEKDRPWLYGMTVIGDPTLRVSGKHLMTINTPGLDSATGVVHYTKDGLAKTGDISGGTWSDECDHGTTLSIDNIVTISLTERYSTINTHSWAVAELLTHTVNYYHQYKPTIATVGLPLTATATVSYVQNGVSKTKTGIWDGNDFNEWCDVTSTVSITNPVYGAIGERYYSLSTTSWTVLSAFSATVIYFHQFYVTCSVITAGNGHHDLTASNHVTVSYVQSGGAKSEDIFDGFSLSDWMDAGTLYIFENPSSESTSTHRWYTPSPTSYMVVSSITTSLTYYEQYLMTVSSSGGLLTSTYKGTSNFLQFATPCAGYYWDASAWSDWCDIGSTLTASQIVLGPPNERYHTPGTVSWTVTESTTYNLPYHKEYKVTIKAEGLPDTLSTTVTIGTADPSPSDDIAGGDINNYELTLDSSSTPPFTWTNWVHADTSLTATSLITVSESEKYILVCWARDGSRFPPPTVYAEVRGVAYLAEYAGIKKTMSLSEAELCDSITVTIEVSNPPAGLESDTVQILDSLPNELSYVHGSARVDGDVYYPIVTVVDVPVKHQQLLFEVDGKGLHVITFEVKVNRAYANDKTVANRVDATFELPSFPDISVDVLFKVTIHPYIGDTVSKATAGPKVVPLFTKVSWNFTYIVKNNYGYVMRNPSLKDNFGAELIYDQNMVIANLLTTPLFSTSTGKAQQIRLSWILPNLPQGEAFMLQVTISTGTNPSTKGQQEYTSPGIKTLNSGATLKWLDNAGKQQSLGTGAIYVTAVGQICGCVKDQFGMGVAGVTVELYYDGKLVASAKTDSSGTYNFIEQLTQSGTYTVKIKTLPSGYVFGPHPSEKTATYNVGQANHTRVDFTVQKI